MEETTITSITVHELTVNENKLESSNWTGGEITINVNRGCSDDGNMDPNIWAEIYDPGNPQNYPGIPACNDEDNDGSPDVLESSNIIHIDDGSCAYVEYCNGECGGNGLSGSGIDVCTDTDGVTELDFSKSNCETNGGIWGPTGHDICGYCLNSGGNMNNTIDDCACDIPEEEPDCNGECSNGGSNQNYSGSIKDECGLCEGENYEDNCMGDSWNISQCNRMDCNGDCNGVAYYSDVCGKCVGGNAEPDCLTAEFYIYSSDGYRINGDPVNLVDTFYSAIHIENFQEEQIEGINFEIQYDPLILNLDGWSLQPEYLSEELSDSTIFRDDSYVLLDSLQENGFFNVGIYNESDSLIYYPDAGNLIFFRFLTIGNLGDNTTININELQIEEYAMTQANFISKTIYIVEELSVISDPGELIPKNFSLGQNYPNPFNPITTIGYSVPNNEIVQIKIYNIRGQIIKSLIHSMHHPGNYEIIWDSTNHSGILVPAGIYLYALETESFQTVKKLVLLK
jgi:hypothetical protein